MTSSGTIYLYWDKSSRTNTCKCFSRVRLTKETTFHPCSDKKDARFGAAQARLPLDRDRQSKRISERSIYYKSSHIYIYTTWNDVFPVSGLNVLTDILQHYPSQSLLFSRLYRRFRERAQFYGIWNRKYYEILNFEIETEWETREILFCKFGYSRLFNYQS